MPIYTKKGDGGTSTLFDAKLTAGQRISKSSAYFEALGTLDELNSYIGIIRSERIADRFDQILAEIQRNIMNINAVVAGASLKFAKAQTFKLEGFIDEWQESLPALNQFILPGGGVMGAKLHYCRTLVRRAERRLAALDTEHKQPEAVLMYVNRLSDFFFVLARLVNHTQKTIEPPWKK